MKTAFSAVLHLILANLSWHYAASQSPPQLLPDPGNPQRIVSAGVTVNLPCPVYGDRDQMIFEWYKDRESLVTFGGHRLRVTGAGALRIKQAVPEDTGVYTCRAVNGFGSVEYNVTLIVLDEEEDYDYEDVPYTTDSESFAEEEEELSTNKFSQVSKPNLIFVTDRDRSTIRKLPGSSVQLHCVATGNPWPRVTWTKDGGELPATAKRGRWSLRLHKLELYHSGNYTCTASNLLGTASHSFYIDVSTNPEPVRGKPEISHPSNTTVEEGQMAILQCMVKSEVPPHIEWLKLVENEQMHEDDFRDVIRMGDEYFQVVKSSDVMDRADGSYFNKLVIREPRVRDSGKYICLGANTNGYSYQSAFLNVLPKATPSAAVDSMPFPIVVAVTVVGIATVAGVVVCLIYCRNRQSSTSSSTGSTAAVPMVTKDASSQRSGTSRVCGSAIYEPPGQKRGHHQVTVYVPQCHVNQGR